MRPFCRDAPTGDACSVRLSPLPAHSARYRYCRLNSSLSAGMHRQAMRDWQAGNNCYTIGPTRFDTANLKFHFGGQCPRTMCDRCGCNRYPFTLLGNVPAAVKFQFVRQVRRSRLASPLGGGAHRICGFCGRRGLFCCFYPLSHALRRASSPIGRAKCCRPVNSNLTMAVANRAGPTVCRRLPACQARIARRGIPANSNLTATGTNREGPTVCRWSRAFQARAVTGHCPINSNLIVAGTNRAGPMVCRRLPACQARAVTGHCPANSNLYSCCKTPDF